MFIFYFLVMYYTRIDREEKNIYFFSYLIYDESFIIWKYASLSFNKTLWDQFDILENMGVKLILIESLHVESWKTELK